MLQNIIKFITGSRLRNKFALFFVVLASVPVLILGALSMYLIGLSHGYDVSNLELQLIDQKIEEINKFFADTLGILELRVGFTQKSEIELSQQKFLLDGLLEENRAFEEVSFIGLEGKETAKKFRSGDEVDLIDVSFLPKFQAPAKGDNFIGDVYYTLSGPFITLASPVRNRNGDIIQILSAEVNLSQIIRSIEKARLGFAGYLVLIDKDGVLIRGPVTELARSGTDISGLSRVKRVLKGEVLDALGTKDKYESFFDKVPVVGAGKKIPRIGWAILAEWPIEDADAIVRDVRNQVINLALFSILAVLAIAPFFAERLLKPIRELEAGAVEIEQGNFEKQVEIKTDDELEDLGLAFNKMTLGLKRLQELKNEFVFIAAHELRTPVTAIKGYLSMILEGTAGKVPEKMKSFLDPVVQSNERLIQLVGDILEIARSEAGRMKIKVSSQDIKESIKAILIEIKPLADEKKISISYDSAESFPKVMMDEGRVKEVVMNLVSNSIKYNKEGGWIKIYHEVKDNFLVTNVEDNGFGMSTEDQKRIFEKFFRAETPITREIIGTGLGLFITRELVEKMGGKIWFKSEEGTGTTFSFSLPIA